MQKALKDVFGPMFEAMLNGEMTGYLGYESNDKGKKMTENRRNGYSSKTIKTSMGEREISVPRDRNSSFESVILPKHKCDVSSIEGKVLAMYSRGMSTRDISATIDDIYGFKLSAEQISKIIDCVLEEQRNWQNRPLKPFYPFIFVDCLYVNIRRDYESRDCAVYTILAYYTSVKKDILGLWIQDTENKHFWMLIFDEIKSRGVQEVGYKDFCAHLKKIYGAPTLKAAQADFERFCQIWKKYPGAVAVWQRNFSHIEQLFDYPSAVKKIMYTTNAIETVNSGHQVRFIL